MTEPLIPVRVPASASLPGGLLDQVGICASNDPEAPQFVWLGTLSGFTLMGDEDAGVELLHRCQESGEGVLLAPPNYLANAVTAACKHVEQGCQR